MTGERQVPFFCPYCGDESLRPAGPQAGDWDCDGCARSFQLRFVAVLDRAARRPEASSGDQAGHAVAEPPAGRPG